MGEIGREEGSPRGRQQVSPQPWGQVQSAAHPKGWQGYFKGHPGHWVLPHSRAALVVFLSSWGWGGQPGEHPASRQADPGLDPMWGCVPGLRRLILSVKWARVHPPQGCWKDCIEIVALLWEDSAEMLIPELRLHPSIPKLATCMGFNDSEALNQSHYLDGQFKT